MSYCRFDVLLHEHCLFNLYDKNKLDGKEIFVIKSVYVRNNSEIEVWIIGVRFHLLHYKHNSLRNQQKNVK